MIKIINLLITRSEKKLSKKEKCLFNKKTDNEKIKLYRKLLNEIDKYNLNNKKITTYRHYRYKTFKIDD